MTIWSPTLNSILKAIPQLEPFHSPKHAVYQSLKVAARTEVERLFSACCPMTVDFGNFGPLTFPYRSMGIVDSLNLFDLDELIAFSFYWANRDRYTKTLDLGANLGLHSIIMDRCGFNVRAYEPDPVHFAALVRNLELNESHRVEATEAAVSTENGEKEFLRVCGNTTSSHLVGSKAHPYGKLERFPVRTENVLPLFNWADLAKLDIEGYEAKLLLMTDYWHWETMDAWVEVENEVNALAIYEHFRDLGVNLFAQKIGWNQVGLLSHMPTSYRDGSLFISMKNWMPW